MEKSEDIFPETAGTEDGLSAKIKPGEVFEDAAENAPIEPGTIFDPEEELKEILKASGEERKKKFEEYKEKYAYQKRGLADMQKAIRERIMDNPEIGSGDLEVLTDGFVDKYGLSVEQQRATAAALAEYGEHHKLIQETLARFKKEGVPETDEKALFRSLFFEDPVGQVDVLAAPTTIYLRCHDPRDFYQTFKTQHDLEGTPAPDFESIKAWLGRRMHDVKADIKKCMLAELDGLVTVENFGQIVKFETEKGGSEQEISDRVMEKSKGIFLHEEQHSVQEIFEKPKDRSPVWKEIIEAETEEERENALALFLKEERRIMETRAKGEFLAYLVGEMNQNNAEEVFAFLKNNFRRGAGAYDYFSIYSEKTKDFLLSKMEKKNEKLINDSIDKIFGDDYEALVKKGVDALERLLGGDYSEGSRERARNLLVTVPLRRWSKEVDRLLKH